MKTPIAIVTATAALAWAGSALADRPLLHVEEKVQVAAPPAKAWAAVGHFGDMSWHPVIASDEISKGKDDMKGAVRTLTTKGGAKIVENLVARNDKQRTITYHIMSSPLPVDEYVATIKVLKGPRDGSTIVWSSKFRRKDEKPAEGADDAGARKAITGIYTAGLENVKKQLEGAM